MSSPRIHLIFNILMAGGPQTIDIKYIVFNLTLVAMMLEFELVEWVADNRFGLGILQGFFQSSLSTSLSFR